MNIKCKWIVVVIVLLFVVVFVFLIIFFYEKVEVVYFVRNIIGYRCGFVFNIEKFGEIYCGIVIGVELMFVICMFFFYGFVGYILIIKMKLIRKEYEKVSELWVINLEFIGDEFKIIGIIDDIIDVEFWLDKNGGIFNKLEKKNEKKRNVKICIGKYYFLMFMLILLVSIFCFFLFWIFVLLEIKNKVFWNYLMYEEI